MSAPSSSRVGARPLALLPNARLIIPGAAHGLYVTPRRPHHRRDSCAFIGADRHAEHTNHSLAAGFEQRDDLFDELVDVDARGVDHEVRVLRARRKVRRRWCAKVPPAGRAARPPWGRAAPLFDRCRDMHTSMNGRFGGVVEGARVSVERSGTTPATPARPHRIGEQSSEMPDAARCSRSVAAESRGRRT